MTSQPHTFEGRNESSTPTSSTQFDNIQETKARVKSQANETDRFSQTWWYTVGTISSFALTVAGFAQTVLIYSDAGELTFPPFRFKQDPLDLEATSSTRTILTHSKIAALWAIVSLTQPILMYTGRRRAHKTMGKLALPLALAFSKSNMDVVFAQKNATHGFGNFVKISVAYMFNVFTGLGVYHLYRRDYTAHKNAMFCAQVVSVGPAIFRLAKQFHNWTLGVWTVNFDELVFNDNLTDTAQRQRDWEAYKNTFYLETELFMIGFLAFFLFASGEMFETNTLAISLGLKPAVHDRARNALEVSTGTNREVGLANYWIVGMLTGTASAAIWWTQPEFALSFDYAEVLVDLAVSPQVSI